MNAVVFKKDENQDIQEDWKISNLIIDGNFDGSINGMIFSEKILHFDNMRDVKITGRKYFDTVVTNTTLSQNVNNVDLYNWIHRATFHNQTKVQYFTGHVIAKKAKFFNSLKTLGLVNGRTFNPNTVLLRSAENPQILRGNLTLISTGTGVEIENLRIGSTLNGNDVNYLLQDSFKSADPQIDSQLVFDKPLEVDHLETEQRIFGVDMEQFVKESNASRNLQNFENNLRYLSKIGENINSSLNDPAIELNHFEYIQSIVGVNIKKIVSLKISNESFLAVHERNEDTSSDVIKFYCWNRRKELFEEEPSVIPILYNLQAIEISQFDKVIYDSKDHLFVEIFDKSTQNFIQQLMILDFKSRTFVNEISATSPVSTKLFTVVKKHPCYGAIVKDIENINLVCISETTLMKTPPIRMVKTLNNVVVMLVTIDNELKIQIWNGEKFVNTLNVLKPQTFTIVHHKHKYYLAVISGRVEKSTHHGSIEIFESADDLIDFTRVQSFEVENPFKLKFSVIPTGDLLLYILTKHPGKALVVYVHAGASYFTKFIGEEVTIINTGTDLMSMSIDEKHEIILIVAKEVFVMKAVLKKY